MGKEHSFSLLAGVLAGLIFYGAIGGFAGGFFFFYLPLLPLFLTGLSAGIRAMGTAALSALLTGLILAGPVGMLLFLVVQVAPALILMRQSLLWRSAADGSVQWYPLGRIMALLCLYATAVFLILALHYSHLEGGLKGATMMEMSRSLTRIDPAYQAALVHLVERWTFLIFGITTWTWLLMIYACGWFAHFILSNRPIARRPSFGLERFDPPNWLLGSLAACGLLSLIAAGQVEFAAECAIIILILPHFLLGLTDIHAFIRRRGGSWFMPILLYTMLLSMPWLGVPIAGLGIAQHCITLYKPSLKK